MKYVLFNKKGSALEEFFKDLTDRADTLAYDVDVPIQNPVLNAVHMVHTSQTIRRYVDLPGQSIWFSTASIDAFAKGDSDLYFLFTNEALAFVNTSVLNKLRKHYPSSKLILIMVDSMHASSRNMVMARPIALHYKWDLILSFNEDDCREYGFRSLKLLYYSKPAVAVPSRFTSDICCIVGAQKHDTRVAKVRAVYQALVQQGLRCDFTITNWPDEKDGIHYLNDYMPYDEMLEKECSSKCILEILKEGQTFQTARYFEAVAFDRKLLTDNPHYDSLPYYDPRFMKHFDTIEDIDADWIRDEKEPACHYHNEFSPSHIPDLIHAYLDDRDVLQ